MFDRFAMFPEVNKPLAGRQIEKVEAQREEMEKLSWYLTDPGELRQHRGKMAALTRRINKAKKALGAV